MKKVPLQNNIVRRDQSQNAEMTIKAAIEDGFKSGISEMDVLDIMKEVEDRKAKDGRL